MRFFKAFNLLHRRTKSATFVPGAPGPQTSQHTKIRTSSFSVGQGGSRDSGTSPTLFDLVTSMSPPIPATFNHIDVKLHESDRVLGLWRPRRYSDRSSNSNTVASLQISVKQESIRLTEAVNFWIQEYSKIQDLLKSCHGELVVERLKTVGLERKIDADRQEIKDLQGSLARYEKLAGKSGYVQGIKDGPSQSKQIILRPLTQLRPVSPVTDSQVTLGVSFKPRTLDEYSSALRMTLATRKALRDQRKITKYWKNVALVGGQLNTVTPSVSTISSIREILPADRQAAVEALMARRGFTTRLQQFQSEDGFSEVVSSTRIELSDTQTTFIPDVPSTLPSFSLSSNLSSRLGPLASESLKQEVSLLFGSHSSSKRLSPSRSRQSGSLEVSKSTSIKELSKNRKNSLSIDSFGDLNAIFQRAFGIDQVSKREDTDQVSTDCKTFVAVPHNVLVSVSSPSYPPNSPTSSEWSQAWVNIESIDQHDTTPEPSPTVNSQAHASLKQAGKECTSRRSWQKYMAQSTAHNRYSGGSNIGKKSLTVRKTAGGKENNGFSMSLPVFKRRNSRLPVPIFGKKEA
ncbi:hypothetical protein GALMADRAFT_239291 [Galerina marginata CBS 339.88]|uniref:Uncharacterized protein n=1 Tax=Galerina marginata (strain CBS 339.88) TaxID=685588 RepID=A0A067TGD4_GALM3|nr:hypothetical protein GALMADRAFT_239291 [Galerina marginata CBS 339.88]